MTRTPSSEGVSDFLEASVSRTNVSTYSEGDSDELSQAIHHIKALRKENEAMRTNMRRLKQVHASALEEVKRLQSAYNRVQDERAMVDREYQRLCESWKVELEEKHKALEQAQHQIMSGRDVEMLRLKVTEEVDGAYRAKFEGLQRDNGELQSTVAALRRELQSVRTELDTTSRKARGDLDGMRLQLERALGDLRDEHARCKEAGEAKEELKRRVGSLEAEKGHLASELAALKTENVDLRARAQQACVDRETQAIDYEKALARQKAEMDDLVRHAESLERRRAGLDEQVKALQRSHSQLASDYAAAEAAKRRAQEGLDDAVRRAQSEKETLEALWAGRVSSLEDRAHELRQQVIQREESELAKEQQALERLEALQRQHEQTLRDTNARWQTRMGEVERDRATAEARITAQDQQIAELIRTHKEETRELQSRLELLRAEHAEVKSRSIEMQQNLSRAREDLARKEGELDEQRRDFMRAQTEQEATAQRFTDVRVRCDTLTVENRTLSQRVGQLEAELMEEKRKAELDKAQLTTQLDSQRRSWAIEKSALVKRSQHQLKAAEDRFEAKLMGMKHRLNSLKTTAQKYAEERTQLLINVRELEAKNDAASRGTFRMSVDPRQSVPGTLGYTQPLSSAQFTSPLEEVLTAIAPQLETIRSKQKDYLKVLATSSLAETI